MVGTPPQTTSGAVILGAMSIRVAPSLGNHGSAPAITSAMRRVPQLHLLVVTAASEPKTARLETCLYILPLCNGESNGKENGK